MRLSLPLVLASLLLSSGCVAPTQNTVGRHKIHELSEAEKRQIKADLLVALKVPDALFSTVRAARSETGEMTVCGWIRVRADVADYPMYPVNRPVIVTYSYGAGLLRDFRLVGLAETEREFPPLYLRCSALGIPL